MQKLSVLIIILACMATGCDSGVNSQEGSSAVADSPAKAETERGGSITVGEQTWTIVMSTQCSIYPGEIINVAGHAAEDPSVEIVIDYNGPDQIRVGGDGEELWYAMMDTLDITIDGRSAARGIARFSEFLGGSGKQADGSFNFSCS